MLHILVVELRGKRYDRHWEKIGIHSVPISPDQALNIGDEFTVLGSVFDAVVIRCAGRSKNDWRKIPAVDVLLTISLAKAIRSLPSHIAMPDGKRWCSIPILMLTEPEIRQYAHEFLAAVKDVESIASHAANNHGGDPIKQRVADHRLAMLADFERVGFIVRYESGRYLISFALRSDKGLETRYYFGPADRRSASVITIHRDNFGIQFEVEAFESLINRSDLQERELQRFFSLFS